MPRPRVPKESLTPSKPCFTPGETAWKGIRTVQETVLGVSPRRPENTFRTLVKRFWAFWLFWQLYQVRGMAKKEGREIARETAVIRIAAIASGLDLKSLAAWVSISLCHNACLSRIRRACPQFWPDVHRDVRPKTSSLGWFFLPIAFSAMLTWHWFSEQFSERLPSEIPPVLLGLPWPALGRPLRNHFWKKKRPQPYWGEIILEMLWKPQKPWIIGFGASQLYSRREFQETLWEHFRGLSGIFPEFLPESASRTGGMAHSRISDVLSRCSRFAALRIATG